MNAYQHYALLLRTSRALALRRIIQQEVRPGMRVLDAGCGSGLLSIWAAQAGAEVIGVDLGDLALSNGLAQENGVADKVTFIRGDLNNVGLEQYGPFDVLLAMVYLNDPRRDEQASALVFKLKRYLKPGATMIPDEVTYRAQALECPAQDHDKRMQRVDQDVRMLERSFGMRMDTFRQALAHQPTKEAFPARHADGSIDLGEVMPLSDAVHFHTVDYQAEETAMPDHCTFPIANAGRFTTVRWTQELRFRSDLIFSNDSIGWVSPPRSVERGSTAILRTGSTWREDNLLEWT